MTAGDRPYAWNSSLHVSTAGLTRTPFQGRHTGLRSVPGGMTATPKRRSPSLVAAFSLEVRRLIRDRAASMCEACGVYLPPGTGQLQHRVARGMGGSRNPVLGSAVNGVLLCGTPADKRTCHGRCEARDMEMRDAGFWLFQYEDPAEVPVMVSSVHGAGCLVWLRSDGSYATEPPEGSAA